MNHARSGEFLWSLERYHFAIDNGTLTEEDKVELLYGKIIDKRPAGAPHEECITLLSEAFYDRFGRKYRFRQEKSIRIPNFTSEPEPDFTVVANRPYGAQRPGPADVFLVVEVANSSLDRDRTLKAGLYAQANLSEYWIINLVDRQLEVHLQPLPEQGRYASVTIYAEQATFTSPFAGKVTIAQFLPHPQENDR
jgi:Uma2 family endonuclease